jgi:hypothetical protein
MRNGLPFNTLLGHGRLKENDMVKRLALRAIIVAIWLTGTASRVDTANPPVGWVLNTIGTLNIVHNDGVGESIQGRQTVPLYEGDILKTEPSSQAYFTLKESASVAMNEATTFKLLTRWEKDKPTTRILRLDGGEVWAKTTDVPRAFEIETPVATVAIKETVTNEFDLVVQPDGQSILTVMDGAVQFGTPFGSWWVRTNTFSTGERGKRCTKPAAIDAKAARAWSEALKIPGK